MQRRQESSGLRVLLCTSVLLSVVVTGWGSQHAAQAATLPGGGGTTAVLAQATATPAPNATPDLPTATPVPFTSGSAVTATITVTAEVTATETTGALEAVDKDGLPVPSDYTSYVGDKSIYRQEITAVSPSGLDVVLHLYRRELADRKWNELPSTVAPTDNEATLMFENIDQQARLELKLTGNADGGTDISVVARMEGVAKAAGILAPQGQARIYFGNITDGQVVFAINHEDVTVKAQDPAQTSMKGVPYLDVPPGQHDFTLTASGTTPVKDTIQLGPDETWALVAGPGGALALQMY